MIKNLDKNRNTIENLNNIVINRQILLFIIFTFLIAFILALCGASLFTAWSATLAAILTALLTEKKNGVKKLLNYFKNWRSSFRYYLLALLLPLIIILLATLISFIFGNPFPFPDSENYSAFILMLLFFIFQAGIGEELGWRGYLCTKLNLKSSFFKSSMIVGVIWAIWHLPMYFISGTIQYVLVQDIGFFPTFIVYSIFIIAFSTALCSLFIHSKNNIWLPILMHGAVNTFGWFFAYNDLEKYGGITMLFFFDVLWVITSIVMIYIKNTSINNKQKILT